MNLSRKAPSKRSSADSYPRISAQSALAAATGGIRVPLLIFCTVFSLSANAQVERAKDAYAAGHFERAMRLFEDASETLTDSSAVRMLCDSYIRSGEVMRGQRFFRTFSEDSMGTVHHGIALARLLMEEGAWEAAAQLLARQADRHGDPEVLMRFMEPMTGLIPWVDGLPGYKVQNLYDLNTSYSEFSPAEYGGRLVFTSDRGADHVGELVDRRTGRPYYTLYASDDIEKGRAKAFLPALQTPWHDGPAAFCGDSILFLNRAEKGRKGARGTVKLYEYRKVNGRWGKALRFLHNSDDYSVAHPAAAHDNSLLLFASDMPGGSGGKDIWYCRREGQGWGKPVNAGPEINTSRDEVFPFISEDGSLYFASDGHGGYGGLDIFSARKDGDRWGQARNLGFPVNSVADDFGIFLYYRGEKGYFTSSRYGGRGGDDLYRLTHQRYTGITGNVAVNDSVGVNGTRVLLVNADMGLLDSTVTDSDGQFRFENLPADDRYLVLIDATDARLAVKSQGITVINALSGSLVRDGTRPLADVTIRLVTKDFDALRSTITNSKGFFRFERLPADEGAFSLLETQDPALNTGLLSAYLQYNDSMPVAGVKVFLANENKTVLDTAVTDASGRFTFENLPPDRSYIVLIDAGETLAMLLRGNIEKLNSLSGRLSNASTKNYSVTFQLVGTDMRTIRASAEGGDEAFRFERLPEDKGGGLSLLDAPDTKLSGKARVAGTFTYNEEKKAVSGVKVMLVDENRDVIATTTTDERGAFSFENLPPDATLTVMIDAEDTRLVLESAGVTSLQSLSGVLTGNQPGERSIRVMLVDKELDPIRKVTAGYGAFEFAGGKEDEGLSMLVEGGRQDKAATGEVVHMETVYYGFDKSDLSAEAKSALLQLAGRMKKERSLRMELGSYADSKGSESYNLLLSNRRMISVLNFLVSNGVESRRITGKGYGEVQGGDDRLNRKTECRLLK